MSAHCDAALLMKAGLARISAAVRKPRDLPTVRPTYPAEVATMPTTNTAARRIGITTVSPPT